MEPFYLERPTTVLFKFLHSIDMAAEDRSSFFPRDQLADFRNWLELVGASSGKLLPDEPFANDLLRLIHGNNQ